MLLGLYLINLKTNLIKNWVRLPFKYNYTSHPTDGTGRIRYVKTWSGNVGKSPASSIYVFVYAVILTHSIVALITDRATVIRKVNDIDFRWVRMCAKVLKQRLITLLYALLWITPDSTTVYTQDLPRAYLDFSCNLQRHLIIYYYYYYNLYSAHARW